MVRGTIASMRALVVGMLGLGLLLSSSKASADTLKIAVVVESEGGLPNAKRLRTALKSTSSTSIVSLSDLAKGESPAAIVTVAVDAQDHVHVLYWDRSGASDLLSAPLPANASHVTAVVRALASAVLKRNLDTLRAARIGGPAVEGRETWDSMAVPGQRLTRRAIHAALARLELVQHRAGRLSLSDF